MVTDGDPEATPTTEWRELLEVAVLAPSAHNSQPWRFALIPDGVEVYADRTRSLPVADPYDRELTISCGAVTGYLDVAARGHGIDTRVEVLPEPTDPDLLARVRGVGPREPTSDERALYAATQRRRTARQPFAPTPVDPDAVTALVATAETAGVHCTIVHPADRRALADLVAEADAARQADPALRRELAAWLRPNDAADDGIPGAALGLGDAASHLEPLLARVLDRGDRTAAADRVLVAASPLILVLATDVDRSPEWVTTGMALARTLLRATALGLSASFLNAPVQVAQVRPRLAALTGLPETFPQVVIRLGYGATPPPSPRRPVADVLADRPVT